MILPINGSTSLRTTVTRKLAANDIQQHAYNRSHALQLKQPKEKDLNWKQSTHWTVGNIRRLTFDSSPNFIIFRQNNQSQAKYQMPFALFLQPHFTSIHRCET